MLYLYQYPGIWGLPSLSPFCMKVETYLKMVQLPYETIIETNPYKGPKGKMPVLKDGNHVIADSSFIIKYLKDNYGDKLDHDLSEQDWAVAQASQRLIEENLYFVILYSRWIDPVGKKIVTNAFKQFFYRPVAKLILAFIRRNLTKQAKAQGLGRHTREEVYSIGHQDIKALARIMNGSTYYLGDKPHAIDASLYAFLSTILFTPIDNPLKEAINEENNLLRYISHMQHKYFS